VARVDKYVMAQPFDLFFHFGIKHRPGCGVPVVWLNGGIMADTGSEKKEYIFDNQFRYPIYAAMIGMRPLLLVQDKSRCRLYDGHLTRIKAQLNLLNSFTGCFGGLQFFPPLFIQFDSSRPPYYLNAGDHFSGTNAYNELINRHVTGGIYLNQVSPSVARILESFYREMSAHPIEVTACPKEYRRMAEKAVYWHDKSNYVHLINSCSNPDDLPRHIPSALIHSGELDSLTWERMASAFSSQTRKPCPETLYIKSGVDAAGEVAVSVKQDDFHQKIELIQKELRKKVRIMGRPDDPVTLIVQEHIRRPSSGSLPAGIGITYNILGDNRFLRLGVIGQVYEDPEHQTFIGSYHSTSLTDHVLSQIKEKKIHNLLRLFAQNRYRGPVNFDAIRNAAGNYMFIYDCNPRLGGTFPGLAFKMHLKRLRVDSLLTLGYRGRFVFPDLKSKLLQLDNLDLLYTPKRQKGLCLIPSFVRPDSFDVVFINLPNEKIKQIIESRTLDILSDETQKDLKGVYF
jgi:hypothetical protein